MGEASISAEKSLQRRYAVREACAQSCWPCSAVAALLRWQCRQASPTLAGNASHALLAQLCADGTAAVARDAYYALLQQECVARSAEPHSGACHALLRQQSLGRTATWPRVRAGHIDLRSSGIYTSSLAATAASQHAEVAITQCPLPLRLLAVAMGMLMPLRRRW